MGSRITTLLDKLTELRASLSPEDRERATRLLGRARTYTVHLHDALGGAQDFLVHLDTLLVEIASDLAGDEPDEEPAA